MYSVIEGEQENEVDVVNQNTVYYIPNSGDRNTKWPKTELEKNLHEAQKPDLGELWPSCIPVSGVCPGILPCCGPGSRLNYIS